MSQQVSFEQQAGADAQSKQAFDATLTPESFTLPIESVPSMSPTDLAELRRLFNRYGVALLRPKGSMSPVDNLLATRELFGAPQQHSRAKDGLLTNEALAHPIPGYIGTSNQAHPLHTDGQYLDSPPRIVVLCCERPAEQGGFTELVSSTALYRHLAAHFAAELPLLHRPDAYTIKREQRSFTRSILGTWPDGRLYFAFRLDTILETNIHPEAMPIVGAMLAYLATPSSRLSFRMEAADLLVIDNGAIFHGRSSFEAGSRRCIHRLAFDGPRGNDHGLVFGLSSGDEGAGRD